MRATVVIPTFDHGPLLEYSVESALNQTIADIEIFIVGDGVPAEHGDAVAAVVRSDPRIRFFDFEKGPRNGEIWRHEALGHASGKIVCYLSDDDLWFSDHVETMEELLREADFANTLPVYADVSGELKTHVVDLVSPGFQQMFRDGENRVPLTCGAHTMPAYRRSAGWRTTPRGIPTDLYMWQELLRPAEVRSVSGFRPTAINFPSPLRKGWTLEQRVVELRGWRGRILDPEARKLIPIEVIELQARAAAELDLRGRDLAGRVAALEGFFAEAQRYADSLEQALSAQSETALQSVEAEKALQEAGVEKLAELERQVALLKEEDASLRARLAQCSIRFTAAERHSQAMGQELAATSAELQRLHRVNHEMASTTTWQFRETLTKFKVIGPVARWVARALIRASDR